MRILLMLFLLVGRASAADDLVHTVKDYVGNATRHVGPVECRDGFLSPSADFLLCLRGDVGEVVINSKVKGWNMWAKALAYPNPYARQNFAAALKSDGIVQSIRNEDDVVRAAHMLENGRLYVFAEKAGIQALVGVDGNATLRDREESLSSLAIYAQHFKFVPNHILTEAPFDFDDIHPITYEAPASHLSPLLSMCLGAWMLMHVLQ